MQTTWKVTAADRDAQGKIMVEPRSLADLLPTHEAIRQDAQRPAHKLGRREMAAMLATGLLALAIFAWTAQTPREQVSAPVVPTAYIVPTSMPTRVPTSIPTRERAAVPTRVPPPPPTSQPVVSAPAVQSAPATNEGSRPVVHELPPATNEGSKPGRVWKP